MSSGASERRKNARSTRQPPRRCAPARASRASARRSVCATVEACACVCRCFVCKILLRARVSGVGGVCLPSARCQGAGVSRRDLKAGPLRCRARRLESLVRIGERDAYGPKSESIVRNMRGTRERSLSLSGAASALESVKSEPHALSQPGDSRGVQLAKGNTGSRKLFMLVRSTCQSFSRNDISLVSEI